MSTPSDEAQAVLGSVLWAMPGGSTADPRLWQHAAEAGRFLESTLPKVSYLLYRDLKYGRLFCRCFFLFRK